MSNVSYILNGYVAGLSRALGKSVTLPEPPGGGYELSDEHRICPGINILTYVVVPRALENAGCVEEAFSLRKRYKNHQDNDIALDFSDKPADFNRKLNNIKDLAQNVLRALQERKDLANTATGIQLAAAVAEWKKAAESASAYQTKAAAKDKEGVIAAVTSLGVAVGTGFGVTQPSDQLIAAVTRDLSRQGGHFVPGKKPRPEAAHQVNTAKLAERRKELRHAEHKEARMLSFINVMKKEGLHGVKSPTQKQRAAIHAIKRRFGVN